MKQLQQLSDDEIDAELQVIDSSESEDETGMKADAHDDIKLWNDKISAKKNQMVTSTLQDQGEEPWKNRHLRKLVRVSPNADPLPKIKKIEDPAQP